MRLRLNDLRQARVGITLASGYGVIQKARVRVISTVAGTNAASGKVVMKKSLLLLLLLGGLASAPVAAQMSDRALFSRVSDQVSSYGRFTIFDSVSAEIENGVVTLSGKVTAANKSSEIEERIAGIQGVKEVRNEIDVLPASSEDDGLRQAIAEALYAHPILSAYGIGPNPSIHIIVEHGQVTLEGIVNNDQDRKIAESVVLSSSARKVINELRTPEEVRKALGQI